VDFEPERRRLVRDRIARQGVDDPRVLAALEAVPRHLFVPEGLRDLAYEDRPLEIGRGQTISQPTIVGLMSQALALRGGEKVLEIGTGSGYQTAVLLALGARVFTVERVPELAETARRNLLAAGFEPPPHRVADGSLGWPEEAPFDRILVAAGAPSLPLSLVRQLAAGGRMVLPVGGEGGQELELLRRTESGLERERICACTFVKLVGAEGW
jgi:protein-L-isoaspartate(D-aspartate) O-methyltransferase